MKKVLILSLAYHPFVGGAEVAIKEITDRIPDVQWHVLTLRLDSTLPKEETIGKVIVHRIGLGRPAVKTADTFGIFFAFAKIFFVPQAALAMLRLNRQERFDGIWAMMSYMLLPVVLARTQTPYLLTLQEGDPFEHVFSRSRIKFFLPLLRSGFKHAAVVQTISTFLGVWARQMGFKGPLVVIPNGVDVAKFSTETSPKELGKKSGDVFLVTASRLVQKNATDVTVNALNFLPENISLIILGDGPEKSRLENLARKNNLTGRVKFLGEIPHVELPQYFKACDIFVRPSRSEGMGNAFIEAMAAGLPVIGTQVGGIADFLFDAKRNPEKPSTGVAVDVDSPEQIAEEVKAILASPEKTQVMTTNAKRLVEKDFEWNYIAERMRQEAFQPLFTND